MNTNTFLKNMMGFALGASILAAPFTLSALVPTAADECAKELLLSYFPEPIVLDTLKSFSIPQDKWTGITKSLAARDKDIAKMVEEKAKTMNPNPLKDPQQRQAAVKLFRDTLMQAFTDALQENGVTNTSNFQAMLDDIQQQKAKKFAMCMEKKKNQTEATADDDADDDDDNYEDDDEDDSESKSGDLKSDTLKKDTLQQQPAK